MNCEICKEQIVEEEMENCLFICQKCWEEINKTKSWDIERRRVMIIQEKKIVDFENLAEFRGRFMTRFLEFLKEKFGTEWYEKVNYEYLAWHGEKYGKKESLGN